MRGSPLFSVELELREAEFARSEVKHGDQMRGGTVAARLAFGRAKDAVESLQERIGHTPFPVCQDSLQMVLHQIGRLDHGTH